MEEKKLIKNECSDKELDVLLDLLYGKLNKKEVEAVKLKIDEDLILEVMWLGLKEIKHREKIMNKEEHIKFFDKIEKGVIRAIKKKTGVKLPRS